MQVTCEAQIRRARCGEWRALLALFQQAAQSCSTSVDPGFFARADGHAFVQYQVEKGQVLVADRDGRLVGFCQFAPAARASVYRTDTATLELQALFVAAGERGQGLGRNLVAGFVDEARRRGLSRVSAFSDLSAHLDRVLLESGFVESRREYRLLVAYERQEQQSG